MPDSAGKRLILIIEDEKTIADTLAQILEGEGYGTLKAYSAEGAIELLEDCLPDLAILDVMLPKMNGIELAILLEQRCPRCRILLFSGQPSVEELLEKARSDGHVFQILAKPVPPAVMLRTVSDLLLAS